MADMDKRRVELAELRSYTQKIDSEVTMILQSLQWDHKQLMKGIPMVLCQYDSNHTVPQDKLVLHETECRLKSQGYAKGEQLLPEAPDDSTATLVTLGKADIINILEYAAHVDPTFKKGRGPVESEPLSLARLQQTYTADERRAIHGAVVSAVPSCHDLVELALPIEDGKQQVEKPKSRAEILAELRDTKRRRTKYRGAAKTSKYSDVLRDVITTQMEHLTETLAAANPKAAPTENINKTKDVNSYRHEELHIKKEPVEDGKYSTYNTQRSYESKDRHKEREKRHDEQSKRDKYRDTRDRYSSSSSARSRDDKDHRNRETYRKEDSRDSRHSKSRHYRDSSETSRYSDRHKRDDDYDGSYRKSHREDKYKRYYDYKDEREPTKKHIKKEKD